LPSKATFLSPTQEDAWQENTIDRGASLPHVSSWGHISTHASPMASKPKHASSYPSLAPSVISQSILSLDSLFISLINNMRGHNKVAHLTVSDDINKKARFHAIKMANKQRLIYTKLTEGVDDDWIWLAQIIGYGSSISEIFDYLLTSPFHLPTILSEKSTDIGIGVAIDNEKRIWMCILFKQAFKVEHK